jgi:hypothetical protein
VAATKDDYDGGLIRVKGKDDIPSFRIALAMGERDWKPLSNALSKSNRKKFGMFNIP